MGLDALCLTDHDNMGWRHEIGALQAETGFPLFLGMEYLTLDGDFVVFGLDHVPAPMLSATELLYLTERAGGIAIACHPYRDNGRGVGNKLLTLSGYFGVEAFNGSTPPSQNLRALQAARMRGFPLFGAGDAHVVEKVGCFATRIPGPLTSLRDFVSAIRAGNAFPVVFEENRFVEIFASQYYRDALQENELQGVA